MKTALPSLVPMTGSPIGFFSNSYKSGDRQIWALGVTHSGELDRRNDSASIRAHSIVQRGVTTPKMSMPNCRLIEQGVRARK
jgi:hypothetical protein